MNNLDDIALELRNDDTKIQLLYAFNSVGKTRLSVAYQNASKDEKGQQTGIYYNAYSEDLFVWDNDINNQKSSIRLTVLPSDLSSLHGNLSEEKIHAKLKPYRVRFDFVIEMHPDVEQGIKSFSFFSKDSLSDDFQSIKISRGEERIFVWCFFLAMMNVEGWADTQSQYIFIDDPVSSLDDHNIFVTAGTLYDLIEAHYDERKIIIATHHVGLFSILCDWLKKGEKSAQFRDHTKARILSHKYNSFSLETHKNDVFLYHLRLIQIIEAARKENRVKAYHFALLRQLLEMISSFLGIGRFSYALERIGYTNADEIARIVNTLSHKKVYYYDSDHLVPDSWELFDEVMEKLNTHFNFITHTTS